MAIRNRNIIQIGETFRTFPEGEILTHQSFPIGTYKFEFSPLSGPSIRATHDLSTSEPKIYGNSNRRVDKIVRKWPMMDRSLGVLLSGDKGMGKSLMTNLLAVRMMKEYNLPVFIADFSFPGMIDFIDENIGEAVIIFDEFEKNFKEDPDNDKDEQTQFLGLLDGMSHTKRMYVLTVNNLDKVNDFIKNRPGRAHYHMNFTYPDADAIEEYVKDKVPTASAEDIATIVRLSMLTKINYDHLRAITTEMVDNPLNESVTDLLEDLNIKNVYSNHMHAQVFFENDKVQPIRVRFSTRETDEEGNFMIAFSTPYGYADPNDDESTYSYSLVRIKVPVREMVFSYDGTPFELDADDSDFAKQDIGVYDKIKKVVLTPESKDSNNSFAL